LVEVYWIKDLMSRDFTVRILYELKKY